MEKSIEKIANTIVANLHNTTALGLFNGKTGIALFLYQYARRSNQQIYEDVADGLIDEIYEKISNNISPDLSNGLSGIGIGLKYLLQNQIVEGNADEVLSEIDKQLLDDPENAFRKDLSQQNPVFSSGIYLLSRIASAPQNDRQAEWINHVCRTGISVMEGLKEKDRLTYKQTLLNSMLYVYASFYYSQNKNTEKTVLFMETLLSLSEKNITDNRFEAIDLLLFTKIHVLLPETTRNKYKHLFVQIEESAANIEKDMELQDKLLWWQFIYKIELTDFPPKCIRQHLDNMLQNYPFNLTTINGQLAVLGLYLMDKL